MKDSVRIEVKLRVWLIPILVGISLILGSIFRYKGWWIILLALGLAWVFSIYAVHHLKQSLIIQREMRFGWAKVGDVLEERILIENAGPMPATWVEIEDHTSIPGHQRGIGTSVSAYGNTSWRTRHVCTRRGLYRLGPTTLHTSDLFNFYQVTFHDPTEADILITPPVVPLPQIEVASGGQTGDGRLSRGTLEQSIAVSTVRDYQPLDPFHHIHWPISAKRNALTTRVFENTPTSNWWIIQDMNKDVQVGDTENNSLELGIILSASLANKGIQSNKAVGFIANNRQRTWIPPRHTSDQTAKLLHTLALSEAGHIPLNTLLQKSRNSFRQAASLIIITPDISWAWWEALLWLRAKGMIPTVLLIDPHSFGNDGDVRVLFRQLRNEGIRSYIITADMFEKQIKVKERPLWEWRVFGTGYAVPVKKPKDMAWKRIK